jgi:L-cysteine S-thiosulfotransferase
VARHRRARGAALATLLAGMAPLAAGAGVAPGTTVPFTVVGDAIPQPLTAAPGDAARGRAIVTNRRVGLCLLCHGGPFPEERFQGTLAPSLAGAGTRWSAGQLRLRVADTRRLNPQSLMPAYHRTDGLVQVASGWHGRPVLEAQQVEDVVAFLQTLRE